MFEPKQGLRYTNGTDVTYVEDLQPLLFHQKIFTHGQLGEVFLHGEEATVGIALHVFRPGTDKSEIKGFRLAANKILSFKVNQTNTCV